MSSIFIICENIFKLLSINISANIFFIRFNYYKKSNNDFYNLKVVVGRFYNFVSTTFVGIEKSNGFGPKLGSL